MRAGPPVPPSSRRGPPVSAAEFHAEPQEAQSSPANAGPPGLPAGPSRWSEVTKGTVKTDGTDGRAPRRQPTGAPQWTTASWGLRPWARPSSPPISVGLQAACPPHRSGWSPSSVTPFYSTLGSEASRPCRTHIFLLVWL